MRESSDTTTFGDLLRHWRSERHFSQVDLANEIETTTRHLSFLETGRSQPSRDMVMRLATALEVPFREQNMLMRAAGFADLYRDSSMDDPEVSMVLTTLKQMMDAHEPFPAFMFDRSWRILLANASGRRLMAAVGVELTPDAERTVFDLMLDPKALRPVIVNWEAFARHAIQRLHRESLERQDAKALFERLKLYPGIPDDWWSFDVRYKVMPFVPLQIDTGSAKFSLFSLVTSVGTPTDVLAQELRIEMMFPSDDDTKHALETIAAASP